MAILNKLPSLDIINGFKGVLDFYVCRGQPCIRKWPKKPQMPRSPASTATALVFKHAAKVYPQMTPVVVEAYQAMVGSTDLTWRDMFTRGYISGTLRYFYSVDDLEEPPD